MHVNRSSSFVLAATMFALVAEAQSSSHQGANGQNYTITRTTFVNNPAPLSSSTSTFAVEEYAEAKAGPWATNGVAYAWDKSTGWDANAAAYDWHHSTWSIVAVNPPPAFYMMVGGTMAAGGNTHMLNPPCAAQASCAHTAHVSLKGKNEAAVYLAGDSTSATGVVSWGQLQINAQIPGGEVQWTVHPTFTTHSTGSYPITGDGQATPGPGKNFDFLSASQMTTSCTLTISSGNYVRAYADGGYYVAYFDIAESKADAVTNFNLTVGGQGVNTALLVGDSDATGD